MPRATLIRRGADLMSAEEGAFIRRRRQCLSCGKRFTTYERRT